MTEIDWSSSGGSDDILADEFATATVQAYPAEKIAPVRRKEVDDGSVVPFMVPTVDANWLPGVACRTFSEVDLDYLRYRAIADDDEGQPADVSANLPDALNDFFVQKGLWEGDCGSPFTADDLFVIVLALARLSKTAPTSGSDSANLVNRLVDELEGSPAPSATRKKEVERQKELVSEARKAKKDAFNDFASLNERVAAACTREAGLLSSALEASSQMARAPTELRQAHNTIST